MRLEYFQLVDRIISLDVNAGTVRTDCLVPAKSPVFEGHFPGYPILPGVLMIEIMAQTGGWLVMGSLRFTRMAFLAQVRGAKMRAFVAPGQRLEGKANLLHEGSGYAVASGQLLSDGRPIADAEITYRVMTFPNEGVRAELFSMARELRVPEALLGDG
ncbi:MAG: beta-hydroxyacyl-ACP dehydratase [Acetobacteraceae bacterium]|nr:beta-hydroxyacyl-ACP dehydratase [Acetobacteraceae bacterium]